jgi:hypothetical protein
MAHIGVVRVEKHDTNIDSLWINNYGIVVEERRRQLIKLELVSGISVATMEGKNHGGGGLSGVQRWDDEEVGTQNVRTDDGDILRLTDRCVCWESLAADFRWY